MLQCNIIKTNVDHPNYICSIRPNVNHPNDICNISPNVNYPNYICNIRPTLVFIKWANVTYIVTMIDISFYKISECYIYSYDD
jgi:hypothetical protein